MRTPDTPMAKSHAYLNRWPRAAATLIDFAIYLALVIVIATVERGHPARVQPAGESTSSLQAASVALPRPDHTPSSAAPPATWPSMPRWSTTAPGRNSPSGGPPPGRCLGALDWLFDAHLHQRRPRHDQARPPAHLRPDHRHCRGQPTGDRRAERANGHQRRRRPRSKDPAHAAVRTPPRRPAANGEDHEAHQKHPHRTIPATIRSEPFQEKLTEVTL